MTLRPNWPLIFVAGSTIAVGALVYRALRAPAAISPDSPNPDPSEPGNVIPSLSLGLLANAGDLVLARDSRGILAGQSSTIQLRIVSASIGPTVQAQVEDDRVLNPDAIGVFQVARGDIQAILSKGSGGGGGGGAVAGPIRWLGDPIDLQSGKTYRARLELTGMTSKLANPNLVASRFRELGFSNVSASKDAPAGWPAEATASPGNGTWFTQGTWAKASEQIERPEEISKAWEV